MWILNGAFLGECMTNRESLTKTEHVCYTEWKTFGKNPVCRKFIQKCSSESLNTLVNTNLKREKKLIEA